MQFVNTYARLDEKFYQRISPPGFKNPELFLWNNALAEELNIPDSLKNNHERLARIFSGGETLEGFEPVALAYAGHQFGNFVPQLGDGRAHLLGEVLDQKGRGRDVQLKGSGQTRFSRRGDGLCALGPAIREFIMSEALYALGVPSTRSLAVVKTGEMVRRDTLLPGAVVTRVASSHIRIGTFEYFAARGDTSALQKLVDYTIKRHYPDVEHCTASESAIQLLKKVMDKQIELVVEWMRVGFVHGVMNTDNTVLSGETIDFGPCAMMNHYDPDTVFSSIDIYGRYAFGNQPKITQWNLTRFAECLLPLIDSYREKAIEKVMPYISSYPDNFESNWLAMLGRKIGLKNTKPSDKILIAELLEIMTAKQADYTNTMNLLTDIMAMKNGIAGEEEQHQLTKSGIAEWYLNWQNRLQQENESINNISALMRKHNPVVIPRNHHVERVLDESLESGNVDTVNEFLEVLRSPYQQLKNTAMYQDSPSAVSQQYITYCGT